MRVDFAAGPPKPTPSPGEDGDARRLCRIMIVEDQLMVAWAMETMVEDMGHKVTGLHSHGAAAIAAVATEMPDLLLMDINLGDDELDGIEAARRIRTTSRVPILFISAYADAATRDRISASLPGAGLLNKPIQAELLRRAIDAMVAPSQ